MRFRRRRRQQVRAASRTTQGDTRIAALSNSGVEPAPIAAGLVATGLGGEARSGNREYCGNYVSGPSRGAGFRSAMAP